MAGEHGSDLFSALPPSTQLVANFVFGLFALFIAISGYRNRTKLAHDTPENSAPLPTSSAPPHPELLDVLDRIATAGENVVRLMTDEDRREEVQREVMRELARQKELHERKART